MNTPQMTYELEFACAYGSTLVVRQIDLEAPSMRAAVEAARQHLGHVGHLISIVPKRVDDLILS